MSHSPIVPLSHSPIRPLSHSLIRPLSHYPLLTLALSLLLTLTATAQPLIPPSMQAFTARDYNAHSQIFCTLVDSATGRVFFGTGSAVLVYDGRNFLQVETGAGKGIFSMDMDSHGALWVGGQSELGKIEPDSAGVLKFSSILHKIPEEKRDFNIIWNTHCIGDKVFFNGFKYLFVYTPNNDSLTIILPGKKSFFLSHKITTEKGTYILAQDKDSGIFQISTFNIQHSTFNIQHFNSKFLPGTEAFNGKSIMSILPAQENTLLIVCSTGEFFRYRSDSVSALQLPKPLAEQLRQNKIYKVAYGPDSTLCIGTRLGGMFLLPFSETSEVASHLPPLGGIKGGSRSKGDSTSSVDNLPPFGGIKGGKGGKGIKEGERLTKQHGLLDNYIWHLSPPQEPEGSLWAGTDNGIMRIAPFLPLRTLPEGSGYEGSIQSILRLGSSAALTDLCIATSQGVFLLSEKEASRVKGTEGQCLDLALLPGTGKIAVAGAGGLLLITPKGEKFPVDTVGKHHAYTLAVLHSAPTPQPPEGGEKAPQPPTSLNPPTPLNPPKWGERQRTGTQKADTLVSAGRDGIFVYRITHASEQELFAFKDIPEEVISVNILPLQHRADTAFLLVAGLSSQGVLILCLSAEFQLLAQHHIKSGEGAPEGGIHVFRYGEALLLGTGKGLLLPLQGSGGWRCVPFCQFGSMFCDSTRDVFKFVTGENGELWMNSGGRIVHLIPDANNWQIDTIPFAGIDVGAIRAIYPDSGGITWFGGDYGLVRYDANRGMNYKAAYHCLITGVTTLRGEQDSVLYGGFSLRNVTALMALLPYAQNNIAFAFSATYFNRNDALRYSWRLEGYDNEWTQFKNEYKSNYTNLPEGKYLFKVKARNIFMHESNIAEYRFTVLPPWYRTVWAYISYLVFALGIVWLIGFLYIRKRRAEQAAKKHLAGLEKANVEIMEQKRVVEQANVEITEQKSELEHTHAKLALHSQEITDSIHYAKRIQNAILPSLAAMNENLKDGFVLSLPKDIVAGDFYWMECPPAPQIMEKEKNERVTETLLPELNSASSLPPLEGRGAVVYFAAADCTGHGVPGAMVSVVCSYALSKALLEENITTTGKLLDRARELVIERFSRSGAEVKDGMDISLCALNMETRQLQWSGANNPLLVISKGVATKYKADKQPIGMCDVYKPFTTHHIQLEKGDMLYLCSDGYGDQFGGPSNKRFMSGKLRDLILANSHKSMHEQKEILQKNLEEWRGELEQVDDITIIGVKV